MTKHWVYDDPRWKKLKEKMYKRHPRKCMATGLTEKEGINLSIDHIKSLDKYPKLAFKLRNLQILSQPVNSMKSNRIIKDWRPLRWRLFYFLISITPKTVLHTFIATAVYWQTAFHHSAIP